MESSEVRKGMDRPHSGGMLGMASVCEERIEEIFDALGSFQEQLGPLTLQRQLEGPVDGNAGADGVVLRDPHSQLFDRLERMATKLAGIRVRINELANNLDL